MRDPHEIHEAEEAWLDRLDLGTDKPVVLDVGANIGGFSAAILDRWPQARVVCFEPNPMSVGRLRERLNRKVTIVPAALTEQPGYETLYYDGGPDVLASLHKRDLSYQGMVHGKLEVSVPAYKLSDFIPEGGVDLLKIDTEGHELAVLKGGGRDLLRCRTIYWEFNSCNLASRTFFKDFWDLLDPEFAIRLIQPDGDSVGIHHYTPLLEDFDAHRDFVAVRV